MGSKGLLRGGRFARPPAAAMVEFSSSLEIDLEMLDEDVDGSIAHVRMLAAVGVIEVPEAETIVDGLNRVREELSSGEWRPGDELEDVHMAVETRLAEHVGSLAHKLHTARSRNDQVATDVRLWLKKGLAALDRAAADLIVVLLDRVESDGDVLMPGYTHLQRGQPIVLAHHLLAHAWAAQRDRERFASALERVDLSPLGACAMAGTPHPIDREMTAESLGFAGVVENAMDAVAARDHEQEVASACAICMTGLSRQAEEMVLWASSEFAFAEPAETFSTGSSIMPQKRNPDGAELVRGKSARVIGDLQALLVMAKGLPMAYNRDLQEDREALFDAVSTTIRSLEVMTGMWSGARFAQDRFESELVGDASLATEIADELVRRGLGFRAAHEIVGRMVRWCEEHGTTLDQVPRSVGHELLPDDLSPLLDPRRAVRRRSSRGGTATAEIERQVVLLKRALAN